MQAFNTAVLVTSAFSVVVEASTALLSLRGALVAAWERLETDHVYYLLRACSRWPVLLLLRRFIN